MKMALTHLYPGLQRKNTGSISFDKTNGHAHFWFDELGLQEDFARSFGPIGVKIDVRLTGSLKFSFR